VPIDILLVGGTGTGKSSTINALFNKKVVTVGDGVDPETKVISSHSLSDYVRFHDSAGLGDGKTADIDHSMNITECLLRKCTVKGNEYGFIDLVLVILDGGSRDMGTTYKLLETTILQAISPHRIIVAINQADMAMKGREWDYDRSIPSTRLMDFLNEKSVSVTSRIKEATGLIVHNPIYYSAKYLYNVNGLIDAIIDKLPKEKRVNL
jgi:predicted GTPase